VKEHVVLDTLSRPARREVPYAGGVLPAKRPAGGKRAGKQPGHLGGAEQHIVLQLVARRAVVGKLGDDPSRDRAADLALPRQQGRSDPADRRGLPPGSRLTRGGGLWARRTRWEMFSHKTLDVGALHEDRRLAA
jgi:hypothetical protein